MWIGRSRRRRVSATSEEELGGALWHATALSARALGHEVYTGNDFGFWSAKVRPAEVVDFPLVRAVRFVAFRLQVSLQEQCEACVKSTLQFGAAFSC